MTIDKKLTLTTAELIVTLELCGFVNFAKKLRKDYRFKDTSLSNEAIGNLKTKGYWNPRRKTKLTIELQEILESLVHSSKMLICENKLQKLVIHQNNSDTSLIQLISDGEHSFSYHHIRSGLVELLCHFYDVQSSTKKEFKTIQTIEITDKEFDSLHTLGTADIEKMMKDPYLHNQLTSFLKDFQRNSKSFHSFSFIVKTSSAKHKTDQLAYFLPNEDFIWHVDYEQVKLNKIYFVPVSFSDYFSKIEDTLQEFFYQPSSQSVSTEQVVTVPQKEDPKPFSMKRGFIFLLKGNLVLGLMILIFFINKNQWSPDGSETVTTYWLLFEILLLVLSVTACLRPKES
ncbi:hypothetical protein JOC75_002841 [Metabacillus crassostreae]|uniref:hypothetical protein n=1 Tax=Metabacillus crassostreae TaxID=929098 RepID=UPI0019577659|nr:hypothetical protein [Metabacillus crassostreae]MBM7604837.1 hypothetical protein [Metabacillus crassostreae]